MEEYKNTNQPAYIKSLYARRIRYKARILFMQILKDNYNTIKINDNRLLHEEFSGRFNEYIKDYIDNQLQFHDSKILEIDERIEIECLKNAEERCCNKNVEEQCSENVGGRCSNKNVGGRCCDIITDEERVEQERKDDEAKANWLRRFFKRR